MTNIYFKSKAITLLILGITSLICSRTFFWLIDDPEGPNLLIVVVLAVIIYGASLLLYSFNLARTGGKKLLWTIFLQILLTASLWVVISYN